MRRIFTLIVLLAIVLLFTGCVSKKKFDECQFSKDHCLERLEHVSDSLLTENRTLIEDIALLTRERDSAENQITSLKKRVDDLQASNYEYQDMLSSKISEKEKLSFMLEDKSAQLKAREQTINALQDMIDRQDELVNGLIERVRGALINFKPDELTVELVDGKIYVAMSDKLMFKPGSADVDQKGKDALKKLAEVLKNQPEITIEVVGHTDTDPINNEKFEDNWDLAVIRATSVTRILTEDYKMDPKQLLPSGRGEYYPVADNKTREGKQKNRRTEIILSPKLDELYDLLKN